MSQETRPRFGTTGIGVKTLMKFELPHVNKVVLGFAGAAGGALAKRIREAGPPVEADPDGYLTEILEAQPVSGA